MNLKKLMELKGRQALVTGAAGHLGKEICDTLAEMGADLIVVDFPNKNLKNQIKILKNKWGTNVSVAPCNLESEIERLKLIKTIKTKASGIDILINNAAFVGSTKLKGWAVPFKNQTLATWRKALEVNLTAVFHLCQAFTPLLRMKKGATIINISSIYGEFGPDWRLYSGTEMGNPAGYAASKGGLIQLSRWMATTLAPLIRVNVISPGGIKRNQPSLFIKKYCARTPLRRLGSENDLRGALAYLASDASKYVTGQVIRVDGGWSTW